MCFARSTCAVKHVWSRDGEELPHFSHSAEVRRGNLRRLRCRGNLRGVFLVQVTVTYFLFKQDLRDAGKCGDSAETRDVLVCCCDGPLSCHEPCRELRTAHADKEDDNPLARAFEGDGDIAPRGKVDRLVFGKLRHHDIKPARLCTDPVFLRRVYLDTIGTLPTADEARSFSLDRSPKKRRELIDALLERDEFAEYWAMKWSDLLRVKAEFPVKLWPNAVQAYHRWIKTSIKENMPYDQFVGELITASGSNFRRPQVNFFRSAQSHEPKSAGDGSCADVHGRTDEELG